MLSPLASALEDSWDAIQLAGTLDELNEIASATGRGLGYRWFAYLRIAGGSPELVSSFPLPFSQLYIDLRLNDEDPIVRHARLTNVPFFWSDAEGADLHINPQERVPKEAVKYGIRSGFTIPIHAGYNKFASLTFAGPIAKGPSRLDILNACNSIQITALQLHTRFAMGAATSKVPTGPSLTWRQRQCLTWSARGKTMSEIAVILGISARTVLFHLQDARSRLGAQTITQAVAQAIRINQIPEA
jgi:LuxR family transcriptional regulator, activator of conjugal transfer of Ti plasmids